MMKRRNFLKGLLAVPFVGKALADCGDTSPVKKPPVIHGDAMASSRRLKLKPGMVFRQDYDGQTFEEIFEREVLKQYRQGRVMHNV